MHGFWTTKNDDEGISLELKVVGCVMTKDRINVIFKDIYEGYPVEARISLKQTSDPQTSKGVWIFTDKQKEKSRFNESQTYSEAVSYNAKVTGTLESFKNERVIFTGIWDETEHKPNPPDSCKYELYIDAKYT